jgi:hypothetical protein
MKNKTRNHTVNNFIKKCAKIKGWDLKEVVEKDEPLVEFVLNHPCYYPTLIEFVGEESVQGNLNIENVQDDISPSTIEGLLNLVVKALEYNRHKHLKK